MFEQDDDLPENKIKAFLTEAEKTNFKRIWSKVIMDISQFKLIQPNLGMTDETSVPLDEVCGQSFALLSHAVEHVIIPFPSTILSSNAIKEEIPKATRDLIACLEILLQHDQSEARRANYKKAQEFAEKLQVCCLPPPPKTD